MPDNILVQFPMGAHEPSVELVTSYVDKLVRGGDKVTVLKCAGKKDACLDNPLALPATCRRCKKRISAAIKMLGNKISIIETDSSDTVSFEYKSLMELKEINYLGTNVGYSALSTYATLTRSADIDVSHPKTQKVLNNYLKTACRLANSVKSFIDANKVDRFVHFNSRMNTYRSFFDLAIANDIRVTVLELNYSLENAMIFENSMPHDIAHNAELIDQLYERLGAELAQKKAEQFFQNRINSVFSNEASYTAAQDRNLMPENWNPEAKNIVVFNSSEHEFMAIGGAWEQDRLFDSQYEGIKFLAAYAVSHSLPIYLRVHPNLSGTQQSYLDKLYELENQFFSVIPPDSKISTYTLMLNCEKVVTFGSSVGYEATYWGKPSILLGNGFYRHLNITHSPLSIGELKSLLSDDVKPIDNKLGCIKIANHLMNPGVPVDGYSFKNGKGHVNGKRIRKRSNLLQKLESKYKKKYLKEVR